MITTYNLNPYYDDFDPKKNFYRILFKPGYAVQARELTQLQTIIQEQINRFGSSIFEEGSIVNGGKTYLDSISYYTFQNNTIDVQEGDLLRGSFSNVKAQVVNVDSDKIWVKTLSGSQFDFANDSVSVINVDDNSIRGNLTFSVTEPSNFGYRFSIDESIFFVKGHFVYVESGFLYLYDRAPSLRLGLTINEEIVTSVSDSSLLDPAAGSYNYSAPGADRYHLYLTLDSKPYAGNTDDPSFTASENFIQLMRVRAGVVERRLKFENYSNLEDTLARRTFDESGNYTVRPFKATLQDKEPITNELTFSLDDVANVDLILSSGKAYVNGYEFETESSTIINLDKARDTVNVSGGVLTYNYGDYIYIDNIRGDPSIQNHPVITLRNSSLQTIGNAFVNNIDYDSNTSSNLVYRLYLSNISFLGSNSVASIANVMIDTVSPTFYGRISQSKYGTGILPYISSAYTSTAMSVLPNKHVKTLLNNGVSDTVWFAKKDFNISFSGSGIITNSSLVQSVGSFIGSGQLGESETNENFFAVVLTNPGSPSTGPAVGTILRYQNGLRVTVNSTSEILVQYANTVTGASGTNFVTGGNSVKLYTKLSLSNALQKNKTLTSNTYNFTGNVLANTVITLSNADGFVLKNVIAKNTSTSFSVDVSSYYTFDTGQRDTHYDLSKIVLTSSFQNLFGSNVVDSLNVTYQYFSHSGTDGFFTVDSYTNSGLSFSQIPSYTSSGGTKYELREVIDFRPVKQTVNTFYSSLVPVINDPVVFDYSYYLPRRDLLTVSKDKSFKLRRGISAEKPVYPEPGLDEMPIYFIDIKPYTYSINDITLKYIDNRRYTMRDIGRIDSRLERVEYYTALNLLEKQAQDAKIPSSVPGTDKFKSGILVDPFVDHSVGNASDIDYKCSIDTTKRELRPKFDSFNYNFDIDSLTNIRKTENLMYLNYSTVEFASQKLSSRFRNLNPNDKNSWRGVLILSPKSDNWVTFNKLELINLWTLNQQTFYEGSQGEYNKHLTKIIGLTQGQKTVTYDQSTVISDIQPTLTSEGSIVTEYKGVTLDETPKTFMRPQTINFVALGHLPDTNLYMYTSNGYKFESDRARQHIEAVFTENISLTNAELSDVSWIKSSFGGTNALHRVMHIHENRAFITSPRGTNFYPLQRNEVVELQNESNQLLGTATVSFTNPSKASFRSNDFGVVSGSLTIPEDTIPSGDIYFVLSNNPNTKGDTWSEALFVAKGVTKTIADVQISYNLPRIPEPDPPVIESYPIQTVVPLDPPTKIRYRGYAYIDCQPTNRSCNPTGAADIIEQDGKIAFTYEVSVGLPNPLNVTAPGKNLLPGIANVNYSTAEQSFTITCPPSSVPNTTVIYTWTSMKPVPGSPGVYNIAPHQPRTPETTISFKVTNQTQSFTLKALNSWLAQEHVLTGGPYTSGPFTGRITVITDKPYSLENAQQLEPQYLVYTQGATPSITCPININRSFEIKNLKVTDFPKPVTFDNVLNYGTPGAGGYSLFMGGNSSFEPRTIPSDYLAFRTNLTLQFDFDPGGPGYLGQGNPGDSYWGITTFTAEFEDIPGWTGVHSLRSDYSGPLFTETVNLLSLITELEAKGTNRNDESKGSIAAGSNITRIYFPLGRQGTCSIRLSSIINTADKSKSFKFAKNYTAPNGYVENTVPPTPFVKKGRLKITVTSGSNTDIVYSQTLTAVGRLPNDTDLHNRAGLLVGSNYV